MLLEEANQEAHVFSSEFMYTAYFRLYVLSLFH